LGVEGGVDAWSGTQENGTGVKNFHHHVVGDLVLAYESLDLRAAPDLTLTVYTAEPDSPSAHALTLLASWAATADDLGQPARPQ
jgi:hypothetical protein